MGKIVKFCASCEEGFAEKFSFCPNCASELSAFEMNPVADEPAKTEEFVEEQPKVEPPINYEAKSNTEDEAPKIIAEDSTDAVHEQVIFEPVSFADEATDDSADMISDDIQEIEVEEPTVEEEVFVADNVPEVRKGADATMATMFSAEEPKESSEPVYATVENDDDAFHVTVVNESGGKVRNALLLSAFAIVIFGFFGLMLYSLFANLDDVASLNEDARLLALLSEDPMQTEDEEKKNNDDEGGGGGGGGKENPKPVSKGELPNQREFIVNPPQVLPRLPNPSLPMPNFTKGPRTDRERTGPIGDPNALSGDPSSGPGRGDGVGRGDGRGVGDGFGDGEGNGRGSGRGGGDGDGVGRGTGDGTGGRNDPPSPPPPPPPPPPPKKVGPTVGIQILSKPKPGYTDEARQNNVRGVVRVKVAFLASGQIGGVSVVSGLPHGLTEKAIAAARQIRFTPPMRNGEPYSVNKTVVFNFNIY